MTNDNVNTVTNTLMYNLIVCKLYSLFGFSKSAQASMKTRKIIRITSMENAIANNASIMAYAFGLIIPYSELLLISVSRT